MKWEIINILDFLAYAGEDDVRAMLSEFACPQNTEIEQFLQKNAIEFARKKMSITYLVSDENQKLVAYFTLTHKSSLVPADALSKTARKRISMHAKVDEATDCYSVSAFLIAQLGKNYAYEGSQRITGDELMDEAFKVLQDAQHMIGGGVVFLECEDKQPLLAFYENAHNRFKPYGYRHSAREQKTYRQLLRLF